jgi:ABC-type transporter Mla MlaB component
MLKITIRTEGEELRLKLEGDLAGTWVAELEECWLSARGSSAGTPACLDLTGVRRVDDAGRYLLALIHGAGARMVATGVEMTDLLDSIGRDWPARRLEAPGGAASPAPPASRPGRDAAGGHSS